ncbi:MAG: hypothetical protein MZV65_13155 [Chromatiales bacterium]|nr:hypothetical protein [Chromatiales bacterium]
MLDTHACAHAWCSATAWRLAAALEAAFRTPDRAARLRGAGGRNCAIPRPATCASTPGRGTERRRSTASAIALGTAAFVARSGRHSGAAMTRARPCAPAACTLVLLADARQLLAAFVIGDQLRAGAQPTLIADAARRARQAYVLLLDRRSPGWPRSVGDARPASASSRPICVRKTSSRACTKRSPQGAHRGHGG